jgi:hypothetical protein
VELLVEAAFPLGRLAPEGAERPELPLGLDHPFHGGGAKAADQLVLQVDHAHVEPERRHLGPTEVGAEAGPLQTAPDVALLPEVTQARQREAQPAGAEELQAASDAPGPAHGHDGDALGGEVPAAAGGQRLERDPVADPFDEHHGSGVDAGQGIHGCGGEPSPLLLVHPARLLAR